jgi:FkbM family methyltransferase
MEFSRFTVRESNLSLFMTRQKLSLYKWITRRAPPVFLRSGDIMTIGPMVSGYYEKEVIAVLRTLAEAGFNKALVDVGANIGLITYHCRELFETFHCFEPNPQVFQVLSANLANAFRGGQRLHLANHGIGERNERRLLRIPRDNYGGAYVPGPSNSYQPDLLRSHGGAADDFDEISIDLRSGRDVFAALFGDMPEGNFVIKIDTEGFEQTIIKELAIARPAGARVAIVFENLAAEFDAARFLGQTFGAARTVLKLTDNIEGLRSGIAREVVKLTRGKIYRLTARPVNWVGTVICIVE